MCSGAAALGQSAAEAWARRYSSPETNSHDSALAIAVDSDGNAIVAGSTDVGATGMPDMLIIKYSGAGEALWTNRYNGPGNSTDIATAVAVDQSGNVFVAGYSKGIGGAEFFDYATIAYSGAGVALWTNRYNGPGGGGRDYAWAIAVGPGGNVFVTGFSIPTGTFYSDYATVAYSGAGVALWTNRYNGPSNNTDQAKAIAVDHNGNVFVTGYSTGTNGDYDYATIAYSGAGVALWTNRLNGPGSSIDFPNALAVDGNGNVFVTGYSSGNANFQTIAYSGAGRPLWTNYYDGPANSQDYANALAVDDRGNVFVTGYSLNPDGFSDYATVAYSGAGVALWTNWYNGPRNVHDEAKAVAVAHNGNVIVTGFSYALESSADYATIAYSGAGVALWTNRYNGPANDRDEAHAVALDKSGNVFVTGASYNFDVLSDIATVKYVWRPQLAIQPLVAGSSTVNLTLSGSANSSWSIERALTITGPWTYRGTSLIGTNALGLFQDIHPPVRGAFYRATQP